MSLRLAPLACALILAACGGSQPDGGDAGAAGGAEEKVLNVFNWSDYVAEDTIANFEAATGIRVNYDVYAENETLETKLTAGGSGYDVVFPSARPFAQRQIRAGLFAELDASKLPNRQHLDPAIMQGLTDIDPGNAHVVPHMWGTTGLGVNVEKVTAALGPDAPLDSWALLFDPANAARLASCGIHVLDDDQEVFGAALIWLGRDPNAGAADEIDAVKQVYAAIRPHIRTFNNAEYKDALANGDACLVMGYSGDIGQARDVAGEAAEATGKPTPDIRYVIPKEGAIRWMDVVAIPKDARHPGNAHAFVDYLMQPEVIAAVTDHVAYANANLAATPLVDPAIAADAGVYPPDDVRARLVDPASLPEDVQRQRVRAWTTIKSGR
ncbi:polyamine ABC transporter substrate-binding protein [Luteimonas sp. MC1750]|uniref:polyamine ABC transporter substrate-binding protein n=1 Tax=Luteimonas sp. MC1750 TaxID=2799326 RepID=UPI0018F0FC51|nr:polyamine ABC transporter substrate-binding protein [Luteimonas sp. MC1750]MBJ6984706.1 polyamine ABC transporter substrate-binding protein [Luteimonas sp. MC1750]QQO04697.1 polyamine ABC transporter substrate-binding protein [Luteimonas sp. MC1750]